MVESSENNKISKIFTKNIIKPTILKDETILNKINIPITNKNIPITNKNIIEPNNKIKNHFKAFNLPVSPFYSTMTIKDKYFSLLAQYNSNSKNKDNINELRKSYEHLRNEIGRFKNFSQIVENKESCNNSNSKNKIDEEFLETLFDISSLEDESKFKSLNKLYCDLKMKFINNINNNTHQKKVSNISLIEKMEMVDKMINRYKDQKNN